MLLLKQLLVDIDCIFYIVKLFNDISKPQCIDDKNKIIEYRKVYLNQNLSSLTLQQLKTLINQRNILRPTGKVLKGKNKKNYETLLINDRNEKYRLWINDYNYPL